MVCSQTPFAKRVACLIAMILAAPLWAQPVRDPVALSATCTGQLSAVMEFQWLMQDPAADVTERLRDRIAELLDAATTDHQRCSAVALRINTKLATKFLLHRAHFGPPGAHTAWAEKRAAQLVANCTAHLIR